MSTLFSILAIFRCVLHDWFQSDCAILRLSCWKWCELSPLHLVIETSLRPPATGLTACSAGLSGIARIRLLALHWWIISIAENSQFQTQYTKTLRTVHGSPHKLYMHFWKAHCYFLLLLVVWFSNEVKHSYDRCLAWRRAIQIVWFEKSGTSLIVGWHSKSGFCWAIPRISWLSIWSSRTPHPWCYPTSPAQLVRSKMILLDLAWSRLQWPIKQSCVVARDTMQWWERTFGWIDSTLRRWDYGVRSYSEKYINGTVSLLWYCLGFADDNMCFVFSGLRRKVLTVYIYI